MSSFDVHWNEVWNALGEAAAAQAGHQHASEPARRFVELISSALASGRAHVACPAGKKPDVPGWGWRTTDYRDIHQGRQIGWLDGEDVYLDPDASIAVAKLLAEETGEPIAVGSKTLHKRLHEKAMLSSTEKERGTLTVRRTLDGKRREVLHLRASLSLFEAEPDQSAQHDDDDPTIAGRLGRFRIGMTTFRSDQRACGGMPAPEHALADLVSHLFEACATRTAALNLAGGHVTDTEFVTVAEAAEILRCDPQRVYDLASSGRLPRHKEGRRTLHRRTDILDLIKSERR